MTTLGLFMGLALALLTITPPPAAATLDVKKVQCDKGQTIAHALKHADPGDTIRVTGTCSTEALRIPQSIRRKSVRCVE